MQRVAVRIVCLSLIALPLFLGGCNKLRPRRADETAYVLAKQTFLRDRLSAVSNRVAMVTNGQHVVVLEHNRHFLKVKTDKGEIGWIEERAIVDSKVVDGFEQLAKTHAKDPVVATAVLRDDLYMHLEPGRDTARYFLLPENDKLQMLVRTSVPKTAAPGSMPPAKSKPALATGTKAATAGAAKSTSATVGKPAAKPATVQPAAEPPPLEDWWLVRDSQGRVGWLLARRMDVDVAEEIAGYAEGQKIVGAYVLTTVHDEESNAPNKDVPEYVAVLNAYKDGLPYDFNQVRVFTWNTKKHRYETAYRQRNLEGYLPVTVSRRTLDNAGPVPTFEIRQAVGEAVAADAQTGAARPAQTESVLYRLDGVMVKKVNPNAPATPAPAKAAAVAAPARGARHAHRASRRHHRG